MRNCYHRNSLALTCGALALGLIACSDVAPQLPTTSEPSDEGSPVEYPIVRKLSGNDGREVEAKIVGRTTQDLHFLRVSDDEAFVFPISQLSQDDIEFIKTLPLGGDLIEPPYVETRRTAISKLERSLNDLRKEAKLYEPETNKRTATEREIQQLVEEIAELKDAIREYKANSP